MLDDRVGFVLVQIGFYSWVQGHFEVKWNTVPIQQNNQYIHAQK